MKTGLVFSAAALTLASMIICCQLGCDGKDSEVTSRESVPQSPLAAASSNTNPGVEGLTILQQSVDEYAKATSYRDRAVLYLSYRLEGRRIQEPHPFSTSWASNNRLASKIFNGQVHADGKRLGCYIFDIDSANLDNQQLLLPVIHNLPITQLYRDSIARHFLGGYSELPLEEKEKDLPPKLIPPPISLLTGQLPFGWIQNPDQVERLPDATLDERLCYVVRSLYDGMTTDIWIDQKDGLILQMSLPLRLMIRKVLTIGEIQDVQMIVRFHDANINSSIDDAEFTLPERLDATYVRNFVSIPESMPCELVGEQVPEFRLFKPGGEVLEQRFFAGQTTALFWLGGDPTFELLNRFSQLRRDLDESDILFGAVYSDLELSNASSGSLQPKRELVSIAKSTKLPIFYDQQLQASSSLQINSVPIVVVIDRNSKIQFACVLTGEDWEDDLLAALQRVNDGEDVAAEMIATYQQYIDDYHKKLTLAGIDRKAIQDAINGKQATGPMIANGFQTAKKLQTKLLWSNTSLKQPGNLLVDGQGNIFVLDGWRTVVDLGSTGRLSARYELEMPEQEAVNRLRVSDQNSDHKWAAFSVQGKQIYLFDANWDISAALPDPDFDHDGIRDAQFSDVDADGEDELIVAFAGTKGIYKLDFRERKTSQILNVTAESMAKAGDRVAYCSVDEMGFVSEGQTAFNAPSGMNLNRLIPVDALNFEPPVVVNDDNQNWFVAGLDNGSISWQHPIGLQFFETPIEPVATCVTDQRTSVFAIADVDHNITLIFGNGELLGQYSASDPINGLALLASTDGLQLVVSTEKDVNCFAVDLQPRLKPVSNLK